MGRRMTESTDVVVIGAGPAGLAVGACLRTAGLDFIIFEKEPQLGSSWRRHYDRLHLHTIKRYSSLPLLPFPKDYPRYVPKDLMIKYLDMYAENFDLKPRFAQAVRAVRRAEEGWSVETQSSLVRARSVVVACGYNAEPVSRSDPKLERFKGRVIHSADYRNAAPFAGQSVLIIGMGNTGAEIALDLAEAGARPTISVRNGVHIVPRELFGLPIQVVAMLATHLLPLKANDVLFPPILDLVLGDLSKFGIRRPQQGILQQIRDAAKIPVIDVGTVRKIYDKVIRIAPGVAQAAEDGVRLDDGRVEHFDAIILATGYLPNYGSFLQAGAAPGADGGPSGIYFVGYRNVVTGLLREISREAVRVANDIARRRTGAGSPQTHDQSNPRG
jgi:cation diffusion facilitator CzcD-associated flavoprotein CzcO